MYYSGQTNVDSVLSIKFIDSIASVINFQYLWTLIVILIFITYLESCQKFRPIPSYFSKNYSM